jgi:hypothetical protein
MIAQNLMCKTVIINKVIFVKTGERGCEFSTDESEIDNVFNFKKLDRIYTRWYNIHGILMYMKECVGS